MQIDVSELQKLLRRAGGRLSFELRDDDGAVIASGTLDLAAQNDRKRLLAKEPARGESGASDDTPGPNYLSILT
jgi:hypothetical protein